MFPFLLFFSGDDLEQENEWNTKGLSSKLNPIQYKKRKAENISSKMSSILRTGINNVKSDSAFKLTESTYQSAASFPPILFLWFSHSIFFHLVFFFEQECNDLGERENSRRKRTTLMPTKSWSCPKK
jgi:hypothetical protein